MVVVLVIVFVIVVVVVVVDVVVVVVFSHIVSTVSTHMQPTDIDYHTYLFLLFCSSITGYSVNCFRN